MRKTTLKGAAVAFTAVALSLALGAGNAAYADPPFTPDADDIVGAGSDTSQFVLNALATSYNGQSPAPTSRLASWDATGTPNPLQPQAGAPSIARPNGSTAGINALTAAANSPTSNPEDDYLDFARSSSPPENYPSPPVPLKFYPFALDSLAIAVARSNADGSPNTNAPATLVFTVARLAAIYQCTATANQWSDFVPGASTATIRPLLPQPGSGTRSYFLSQIGLTEAQIVTKSESPGSFCVNDDPQEHDPAPINSNANAIAPFSVGRYNTDVPVVNGQKIIALRTSTGNFNPSRRLYNVVKVSRIATVGAFFSPTGFVCSAAADAIITANGFTPLPKGTSPGNCGV
ncbi:substrate-binding domain-containing protein [Polymorphospora sp. NPDC050346]|uniref:PstS family phosphate ABC transporter substrate-binding protein n=1 Tax=Polymorphospora sp. NPDC050346 TaxID=3155780 RepID=UPI0033ED5EFD